MNNNIISVVLVIDGAAIVYNHVSAGKAYRLINDFSHSIGNGDLLTSKSEYKTLFRMSTVSHINLAKDKSAFALAINETLTDLDTILQQYNLSEAA